MTFGKLASFGGAWALASILLGGCAAPVTTNESAPVGTLEVPQEISGNDDEQVDSDSTGETAAQSNARRAAENYLDVMAFSRSGLIEQLQYEGYSKGDATYAVDALSVDWKEQAAKKAQEYLNTMPFSRSSLLDQLMFEGFSTAEAQYGVSQSGL